MLNHPRIAVGSAILAAALAAAACSSSGSGDAHGSSGAPSSATSSAASDFPVTVQAGNGSVTIKEKPTAIVSLSPTATEMLFAIGAGSQVKAADKNSTFPADAPTTDLDAYQLNAEAVAAYQPDLVVTSGLTPAQMSQLKKLHIPLLDEPAAQNLDEAYVQLTQLGQVTGHPQEAATEVDSLKAQVADVVDSVEQPADGAATYYYELDQTYYSETSSTFIGQVLRLLGLKSIADEAKGAAASGGYPQLTAEFILKSDPDYVFLADTKCCKQSVATVAKRPGWRTLGAVQDDRVIALDDDIASRWGPRIVDLMRTVADAITKHPAPATP